MRGDRSPPRAAEGIVRNTVFALGMHLTSAAFTATLTLFLVRALSPDGYGVFALALGIGALATLPSDLGISASAARFIAEHRDDRRAVAAVIADALKLKLVIAGIVSVALFALSGPIAAAYGAPELLWPLRGIAVAVFGQSLMLLFGGAFIAQGRTSRNFRLVLGECAVELGASVALVLFWGGAAGAAFGRAVGYSVGVVLGLLMLMRLIRGAGGEGVGVRGTWMRQIAAYAGALAIIDWVYTSLTYVDVMIIGALLGTTAVGVFQAPLRLIAFPLYLGLAVASGVAPRLARHGTEPPDVRPFVAALRLLIVYQAAIVAVLLAWAEPIVDLLLGSGYGESVDVFRALAPFVFLAGLAPLISLGANYLGAARSRIPIAVAALVLNAALDLALIPLIGVVGAAIATSAGFALYVPGHLWVCRRLVPIPLRPILVTLVRSAFAAAALGGVLVVVGTSSLSPLDWALGSVGGMLAFVAVLLATKELSVSELRNPSILIGRHDPQQTAP
jgi:O-antigen/teichoic acid export membrane protein